MSNYLDGMDGGKHNSDNTEVSIPIKTFTVSVTFTEVESKNPLEAAKKVCEFLEEASSFIYNVKNEITQKVYNVDLFDESVCEA
jgi:hypothetical protein